MKRERILAIDDSRLVRDMLISLLTENNFDIHVAASGNEGLHYNRNNSYDLILLDYMLPDINGLQMLTKLSKDTPSTPVIMLTSKGNEGIAVQAMKLGAIDYVIKSSDFILQLPLIIRSAIKSNKNRLQKAYSKDIKKEYIPSKIHSQRIRVLLVDDNDVMKTLMGQILEINNFATTLVKDGEECLEVLKSKSKDFDLILINFLLPDMDGLELMEKMNKIKINIPSILLSSKGSEITAVKAMKLGAIDYIVKQPGYLELLPDIITNDLAVFKERTFGKEPSNDVIEIKEKILFLSVNADLSDKLSEHLIKKDYEILCESKINRFLNELIFNNYDIVIIDNDPPQINSSKVLVELNKIPEKFPIIVIDNDHNTESATLALKSGASHYISKSEVLSDLLPLLIKQTLEHLKTAKNKEQLEIEVREKNKLLNTKLKELKSLNDITRHIVESLDLEKSLYNIVAKISELTGAERISIMIHNEKRKFLTIRASKGFVEDEAKTVKVYLGENIAGYVAQTGKSLFIPDIEKHPRFKKVSGPQYKSRSLICVPVSSKNEIIGVINASDKSSGDTFTVEDFDTISNFANYVAIAIETSKQYMEIKTLSLIDDLTGCYNKRFFNDYIEKEIERSKRYKRIFSVAMLDIDKFKEINDTYGHYTGDLFLKDFCSFIQNIIRLPDILIRYGGEEFLIILPNTSITKATLFSERLRSSVEKTRFIPDLIDGQKKTVSIGVAKSFDNCSTKELIENVDNALYEAKWKGRNKVCSYKQKRSSKKKHN